METPIVSGASDGSTDDTGLITDTTTASFTKDVIEASRTCPILVDFWAPWCGPCKQLGPLLEKIVKQAKGTIRLVKINIDENPAIASQMGVQSIPAVFAYKDGRPVDRFMGALPESQIKSFIERISGPKDMDGMDNDLETARSAYEAGDYKEAAEYYAAILGEDRANLDAIAGLAKCYIAAGELAMAEKTLALTPSQHISASAISAAEAALALARKGGLQGGNFEKLNTVLESHPNDHQARYDLALALQTVGEKEPAMEQLFEIMNRSRTWNESAAQKQLVELFVAWGPEDKCTIEGRRQLSSLLFV